MCPQFHLDLGPFSFTVSSNQNGITLQRGTLQKTFAWDSMTGALLVRPQKEELDDEEERLAKAEQFLGASIDLEKIKSLKDSMAAVHIAYRDERKRLRHEEIPIPVNDNTFLDEFKLHVGKRWLGEARDQHEAEKKLHTATGFFKTLFYLFVILAALIMLAAFGIYSLAAPALNFLSLRQIYFDFQDGNYAAFGFHVFVYFSLFTLAYALRRLWRNWRESKRGVLKRPRL